jgi:hypothetical protein
MGVSKGDVSQSAVLSDLDLSAGSIRQRAVLNRAGKTGGTMSLSEHRGVACAPQLNSFSVYDGVSSNTNTGYGGFYPSIAGSSSVSGTTIVLSAGYSGAGGPDGTSEHRTNFKVTESGTYRIVGTVNWQGDNYYYLTYYKVCVATNRNGYLQGLNDLPLNYDPGIYVSNGTQNINQTFSLSTSRPYATLVLYAVRKGGGDSTLPKSVARFDNFKVTKE